MALGVIETVAEVTPHGTITKQDCPSGVQYFCYIRGNRWYSGSVAGCRRKLANEAAKRATKK